jgi:RNA polymerase sigma factor (sigma-70 family)
MKNPIDMQTLFNQNRNVIHALAKRYRNTLGYDDAYQEASILLYRAIKGFDPQRGSFDKYFYSFGVKELRRIWARNQLVKSNPNWSEARMWLTLFNGLTHKEKMELSGFSSFKVRMIEAQKTEYSPVWEDTLGEYHYDEYNNFCLSVFESAFGEREIKESLIQIYMYKAHGFSYSEIAEILGIAKCTVAAKAKKYEPLLLATLKEGES